MNKKRPHSPHLFFTTSNSGFTLIELLVVIFIIGVLATLTIVNLQNARQRARDTRKKNALNNFKTALRLYYNDYQNYPGQEFGPYFPACGEDGDERCPVCADAEFAAGGADGCATIYMQELPTGLGNGGIKYYSDSSDKYCAKLDGDQRLENLSDADLEASFNTCNTICNDLTGNDLDYAGGEYAICNQ
jgi:prepilin-type N-terminal cleavage/methylation domain-containing protein